MSYPEIQIVWYKKTSATGDPPTWEAVGTNITDFMDLKEDESIPESNQTKTDTFSFKFHNVDTNGDGFGEISQIKYDDLIEVKFRRDGSGSFVQVMSGKITSFSQEINPEDRVITINGINRTQSLLRTVFALDLENSKPPMMVASILAEANEMNVTAGVPNKIKYVYYNENLSQYEDQDGTVKAEEDVTIQRKKSDGSEFEVVGNFNSWYEQAVTQVQKLSSADLTKDGNYIFYIDSQNNAYWKSKETVISGLLKEGSDFTAASLKYDSSKIVNFYIIHCGTSPYSYGILWFASNDESIAAHGLSGKFLDRTSVADNIMKLERNSNPSDFTSDSYPFPTAGALAGGYTMFFANGTNVVRSPFTVDGIWYSPTGNDGNNGSTVALAKKTIIVNSTAKYNEAIVKQSKMVGASEARPLLDAFGEASWSASLTLNGTTAYNKGELINLEAASMGWIGASIKELQITEVGHTFSKEGWNTTLYLEEQRD